MSRRPAVVWPMLLTALALSGCASGSWFGDGAGHGVVDESIVAAAPHAGSGHTMAVPVALANAGPDQLAGYIAEAVPRRRAYVLDTGDRLRVFVYGQPNLSRLYNVDQSGSISVPLIGTVHARGMTTSQLEGSIRARLAQGLVRDPQVTVDVQQNRPFFILGEVRNGGQFPYVTGMTVEVAVAIAGGYGERADERRARITRRTGGISEAIEVAPDTALEPGDTVYIHERFF